MLTENQKQIIESLTNEFTKMNAKPDTPSGGLIDRLKIDSISRETENMKQFLKMKEKKIKEAIMNTRDSDIERMNVDLEPMGFIAKARYYERVDYIQTDIFLKNQIGKSLIQPIISLEYEIANQWHKLPSGENVGCHDTYKGVKWNYCVFKNIEELCSDASFINHLVKHYNK